MKKVDLAAQKISPNNQGFSLMSVLVAAAVGGIIMTAFVQFINNSMKAQQNVGNSVDFDILKSSIEKVLSSKLCDGSLKNSSNAPVKLTLLATLPASGNALTATVPVEKISLGTSEIVSKGQKIGSGLFVTKLEIPSAIVDGNSVSIGTKTYQQLK